MQALSVSHNKISEENQSKLIKWSIVRKQVGSSGFEPLTRNVTESNFCGIIVFSELDSHSPKKKFENSVACVDSCNWCHNNIMGLE